MADRTNVLKTKGKREGLLSVGRRQQEEKLCCNCLILREKEGGVPVFRLSNCRIGHSLQRPVGVGTGTGVD